MTNGEIKRKSAQLGTVLFAALTIYAVTLMQVTGLQTTANAADKSLKGPSQSYEDVWPDLQGDIFDDRKILDGKDKIALKTPYRAHDAALVPVTITALNPQNEKEFIKQITLVIDKNPAPVAAVFTMGMDNGVASLSTRIRINNYSYVRAIAETNDGKLYMVRKFVKASGGCSAPAGKDPEEALANMGKMKFKQFSPKPKKTTGIASLREAQLMIRHPNASGLQMDQVTGLYIPAHFVQNIDVMQGDRRILSVEGAISLSEDPSVRFHFVGKENEPISVRVKDTESNEFKKEFKVHPIASEGS